MSIGIKRFKAFPTTVLSDAMEKLGKNSALGDWSEFINPALVVGRAVTMKLETSNKHSNKYSKVHLGAGAISLAGPGDVIVVGNNSRQEAACWGGLLALGAKAKGVSGILVDGQVRDVDEISALGIPVLARGYTPLSARGRYTEAGTNLPIEIKGVRVEPGDIVVMDGSGAVIVPSAMEKEVFKAAQEIQQTEEQFEKELKAGINPTSVLDHRYELMTKKKA